MGEMKILYKILVGKHEGKRLLEINTRIWDVKNEQGISIWTGFIWHRTESSGCCLVNTIMKIWVL
jgi:hypothetical protein